jgi:hypothetical protein
MVTEPGLWIELPYAGMVSFTVPLVMENLGVPTVIQSGLLDITGAGHEVDPFAVIVTLIVPPLYERVSLLGEML